MEQLRLADGIVYDLVTNGVQENDAKEEVKYIFVYDGTRTFEEIENEFTNIYNTDKVHVLDALGEAIRTIVGYTQYKGMEKRPDYVVSDGDQDDTEPETTTVMIVTMSKPDLHKKFAELQDTVDMLVLTELGA